MPINEKDSDANICSIIRYVPSRSQYMYYLLRELVLHNNRYFVLVERKSSCYFERIYILRRCFDNWFQIYLRYNSEMIYIYCIWRLRCCYKYIIYAHPINFWRGLYVMSFWYTDNSYNEKSDISDLTKFCAILMNEYTSQWLYQTHPNRHTSPPRIG